MDVLRCRHDVVVTGQHHGGAARHEFGGMGNEALKPGQLIVEFRSRLWISVGEVNGSDQDSLNSRFDVASLVISRISRQACAGQHGSVVSRENCDAVPGTLPLPDCFVAESPKGIHGKGSLLSLELLETHHVRFSFGQPSQKVVEPLIDVVDVEGGDFHQAPFCPCTSGCLPTHLVHPLKDNRAVVIHTLGSSFQRSRKNCSEPCRLLPADIPGCGFVVVTTCRLCTINTRAPFDHVELDLQNALFAEDKFGHRYQCDLCALAEDRAACSEE